MSEILPYKIINIRLNESLRMPQFELTNGGNYVVFWWKQIGLGHIYLEPKEAISEEKYYGKLIKAITPAIDFYSKDVDVFHEEWKEWLVKDEMQKWSAWLEIILGKWTNKQVPSKVPVSVVICTRDRAGQLRDCLRMLNQLASVASEIVVVDNAPTNDDTKNVTAEFEGVKYVREPRPGLDIARNTGITNTTFPIVAFVDDDVLVQSWWLYHVWQTFEDPAIGAMTGLVIASKLDTEAQQIFEKHWSFNRGYADKIYDDKFFKSTLVKGPPVWEIGAGANMAFRRNIFDETGLFNEYLDAGAAGCNGDSEMWFRVLARGHSIYYNPRAIVHHEHRKDMKGLKKQIFYYMRGFMVAALTQQQFYPASGYRKSKIRNLPREYMRAVMKGFPKYEFQYKTIIPEIKGIISGYRFFQKNKEDIL